jgi:predicted transglutaminase-like cysteine proteinase
MASRMAPIEELIRKSAILVAALCAVGGIAVQACAQTPDTPPYLSPLSVANLENTEPLDIARLPNWQRIRDWMVDSAPISDPSLSRWASWAAGLRAWPIAARLDAINHRVNDAFPYAADPTLWGVPNHWSTPQEIVAKGATDCKGFAIMKFWLARLSGVDGDNLALLVGFLPHTHRMHAVLLVTVDGAPTVLDSLQGDVVDAAMFGGFRPLLAADLHGLRLFIRRQTDDGQRVIAAASVDRLGRPKER